MKKPRRNHSASFQARVALEAIRGHKTVAQIAAHHEVCACTDNPLPTCCATSSRQVCSLRRRLIFPIACSSHAFTETAFSAPTRETEERLLVIAYGAQALGEPTCRGP